MEKKLDIENSKFSFNVKPQFTFALDDNGQATKKRLFSGVAYSGGLIEQHWYWGSLVFDLSSMSVPNKLPALVDHDSAQRAGYVTESSIDNETGFSVKGNLLTNGSGSQVASESDEGFPWQMSVRISPGSVEEVTQGTSVEVNGKIWQGPVTVFRNSTIQEVSFTALGWDSNTSATALSKKPSGEVLSQQSQEQIDMEKVQELEAKLAASEAENVQLKASNAQLIDVNSTLTEKFSKQAAEQRGKDIEALFSITGQEFKADSEEVQKFSKMDQETFEFSAKMLKSQAEKAKPAAGNNLFGHIATDGQEPNNNVKSSLVANAESRAKTTK